MLVQASSQAWRSWRSAKAAALLAATALAVGIGSATAISSVVNAVMLKPLPYGDGDRFVALFGANFKDPALLGPPVRLTLANERRNTSCRNSESRLTSSAAARTR